MTDKGTVYPRFIGVDSNGDFVWELASGRWTWGDDPLQAATRLRTFTPDRYLEKYGPVDVEEPFLVRVEGTPAEDTGLVERVRSTVWTKELDQVVETRGHLGNEAYKLAGIIGHVRALVGQPDTQVEPVPDADKILVSRVLYALLVNLDGWIDGAHDNHEGMGHRGESTGGECWRQFAPDDIRNMINDVAREFGVSEFPRPDKGLEDTYR
jgi:hypothetical protein